MCGRFGLWATSRQVAKEFLLEEEPAFSPRYNIAPSRKILAVGQSEQGKRSSAWLRWGLKPHWFRQDQSDYKMINARAETMFKKPAFRAASRKRRCLIPASCFFEWQMQEQGNKQPFCICPQKGDIFAFAGIWEYREGADSQDTSYTCAIVTTRANEALLPLHNRMPVIITRENYGLWLDKSVQEPRFLKNLLEPLPSESLRIYRVGLQVNNSAHDSKEVISPIE